MTGRAPALSLVLAVAACGGAGGAPDAGGGADAAASIDAAVDGAADAGAGGFGDLGGMCGVLAEADLTGAAPELVRARLTFDRAFVDPDDRPLLTAGGRYMLEVGNAGGSSLDSEVFAYEELARCEQAALLKTETEIVYDTPGKITDFEVELDGHKIGVSVTRAVHYPFGDPYTIDEATTLATRKLDDIQVSTADVSAADRWDKQILAVLAWDDAAADTFAQAWATLDDPTRGDTIVLITTTDGDDQFIY